MKFWKHSLLAATTFLALGSAVLYTSCTQDSCETLKCRNNGTCVDGFCRCPDGYEGGQCEVVTSEKILGVYDGITKINQDQVFTDSAYIWANGNTLIATGIHSRKPEQFGGKVVGNNINIIQEPGKIVTMKRTGENKVEIFIEETIDGVYTTTNFSGTRRTN